MRVNSVCMGFFTGRLLVAARTVIVMSGIFLIASSFTKFSDRDARTTQMNLIIRQIGHQLLLQSGDLTSRVLPVTESKSGTFLLRFENEFAFNHDSLLVLAQALLPKTEFPSGYTVTAHDCTNADIIFGFQLSNTTDDLLPCRGRSEPLGCYTIEFAFPDFVEDVEEKKADIDQSTEEIKPAKVVLDTKTKHEIAKSSIVNNEIDKLTTELKSFNLAGPEVKPAPEELKTTASDYPLVNLFYFGVAALGITFLIGRFRKMPTPIENPATAVQNQNHSTLTESTPKLASLGKFLFDEKRQHLLLGIEVISLTDKECKILELFSKNFGELIHRETLMQKVWIDEGVITGRSLDMFVSKLRKKLSGDPELRITNVHGKGYKLEVLEEQVA